MTNEELDQLSINTIRTLSIDAVQQAKSGHPGTPMALATIAVSGSSTARRPGIRNITGFLVSRPPAVHLGRALPPV
jgi:Transketolase, thiamine diphosphate binding domain